VHRACSAYKFYGPHVGVLWGRQSLVEELDLPRLEPAPVDGVKGLASPVAR
jgi:selenocysteine lyase/cysteine desulfurase